MNGDRLNCLKLIRKLQPGIIVDNRLNLEEYKDGADFETPEQVSTAELAKYRGKTWETCQTFSGSWGYYRDENTWKTHRQLLGFADHFGKQRRQPDPERWPNSPRRV
jgi:hypothetical protein